MSKVNLGRVGFVLKGDYDAKASYKKLDCVKYNLNSYGAKQDVPAGKLPTDTTYWMQLTDGATPVAELRTEVNNAIKSQNTEIEKKLDETDFTAFVNAYPSTTLEKAIEAYYAMRRTGKIYGVKIYKFASNPTTAGVRLADAAEMTYAPSTEATAGQDDFIDKAPMFDWVHVNYVRDDDGAST